MNMNETSSMSDEQLIESVQDQGDEALRELSLRHKCILKSAVLRILHDDTEADDVLQEILLEIWHHAKQFSPAKGKPLAWMVAIARRRAIDRLRKLDAYGRAKERFLTELAQKAANKMHNHIAREILLADERSLLEVALGNLPKAQKQVILLAYYYGLSQRQIAVRTSVPLGTIKTRLALGLAKMSSVMVKNRDKIW